MKEANRYKHSKPLIPDPCHLFPCSRHLFPCSRHLIPFLLIVLTSPLPAVDFGVTADISAMVSRDAGDAVAGDYSAALIPWFSWTQGPKLSLYFSGSVKAEFKGNGFKQPLPLPELGRFEAAYSPIPEFTLRAGRLRYGGATRLAADGLFDGITALFMPATGDFTIGFLYSGFLYKETAMITMTEEDTVSYAEEFRWGDDFSRYFAPRRGLAFMRFDKYLKRTALTLESLMQFDFSGSFSKLHSQYFEMALSHPFSRGVTLGLAFSGSLVMRTNVDTGSLHSGIAADLSLGFEVPGGLADTLSVKGRYSSGNSSGFLRAYRPITGTQQGGVFTPTLGGIAWASVSYTALPADALSLSFEAKYFFKTDPREGPAASYSSAADPYINDDGGAFLGLEAYLGAAWALFEDLMFTAGGGAFVPQMGNAFHKGTPLRWSASVGATIAY